MVESETTIDTDDQSENDIEILNKYLAAVCFTLLEIDKDFFYKELHQQSVQQILKTFAAERNQKVLLVSKIAEEPQTTIEPSSQASSEIKTELIFGLEVLLPFQIIFLPFFPFFIHFSHQKLEF